MSSGNSLHRSPAVRIPVMPETHRLWYLEYVTWNEDPVPVAFRSDGTYYTVPGLERPKERLSLPFKYPPVWNCGFVASALPSPNPSVTLPLEVGGLIYEHACTTPTNAKSISLAEKEAPRFAQASLFSRIVLDKAYKLPVWIEVFEHFPQLARYVKDIVITEVPPCLLDVDRLVTILSGNHPFPAVSIIGLSSPLEDALGTLFPMLAVTECLEVSRCYVTRMDLAAIMGGTPLLTSLSFGRDGRCFYDAWTPTVTSVRPQPAQTCAYIRTLEYHQVFGRAAGLLVDDTFMVLSEVKLSMLENILARVRPDTAPGLQKLINNVAATLKTLEFSVDCADKNAVYLPFTLGHASQLQSLTFSETSYCVDFIADTLMTLNSNTRLASLFLHIGIVDTCIDWPTWIHLKDVVLNISTLMVGVTVRLNLILWEAADSSPDWARYEPFVMHVYDLFEFVPHFTMSIADELETIRYFQHRRD